MFLVATKQDRHEMLTQASATLDGNSRVLLANDHILVDEARLKKP